MISDQVLLGVLSFIGTVIAAWLTYLGVLATRTNRHARATRNQVQNSHDTNLRDDLDANFADLRDKFRSLSSDVGGMKSDIRGIRREALVDREAAAEDRKHLQRLEDTLTPEQIRHLPKE